MKTWLRKLRWKILIFSGAFLLIVAISFVYFYQPHYSKNKRTIYENRGEYHPIVYALFDGNIIQGQSADYLLKEFPPSHKSTHDNYMTLLYAKGYEEVEDCCVRYSHSIFVYIQDHKVVKALASEGFWAEVQYTFFNVLDKESEEDYWTSRLKYASAK